MKIKNREYCGLVISLFLCTIYVSARRAKRHLNRSRDNMASFYVGDYYDYLEDDDEMEYER